jgi:hypothetical protein
MSLQIRKSEDLPGHESFLRGEASATKLWDKKGKSRVDIVAPGFFLASQKRKGNGL